MVDNWRKKGLLRKDTRWRDIDTTNTVLARCYGLRTIHKENYPLRLVFFVVVMLCNDFFGCCYNVSEHSVGLSISK